MLLSLGGVANKIMLVAKKPKAVIMPPMLNKM